MLHFPISSRLRATPKMQSYIEQSQYYLPSIKIAFHQATLALPYIYRYFGIQLCHKHSELTFIPNNPQLFEVTSDYFTCDPAALFNSVYLSFLNASNDCVFQHHMKLNLEKIAILYYDLAVIMRNKIPEFPLTLENNIPISIEIPSILKSIFNRLNLVQPGARNYYSCRAKISGDFTSDFDVYSSVSLTNLTKILEMNLSFDGYLIQKVDVKTYPVDAILLHLKTEEIEYRVDVHCGLEQIIDIANPNAFHCTNFASNTYIATEINGQVVAWNCFEIFHNVQTHFLSSGIPIPILKEGETIKQFYSRNPINIPILLCYLSQSKKYHTDLSEEFIQLHLTEKIEVAKKILSEIGSPSQLYDILRRKIYSHEFQVGLPKDVIVKRLVRAFSYGEAVSNFKMLKETGILILFLFILQKNESVSYASISKEEIIEVENLLNSVNINILKEFDAIYNDLTKKTIEEENIYVFLLLLCHKKTSFSEKELKDFFSYKIMMKNNNVISNINKLLLNYSMKFNPRLKSQEYSKQEATLSEFLESENNSDLNDRDFSHSLKKDENTINEILLQFESEKFVEENMSNIDLNNENIPPIINKIEKPEEKEKVEEKGNISKKKKKLNKQLPCKRIQTSVMEVTNSITEVTPIVEEIHILKETQLIVLKDIIRLNKTKLINNKLAKLKILFENIMGKNVFLLEDFIFIESEAKISFKFSVLFENKDNFIVKYQFYLHDEDENKSIEEICEHILTNRGIQFKKGNPIFIQNGVEYRYGKFSLNNGNILCDINWNMCFKKETLNELYGIVSLEELNSEKYKSKFKRKTDIYKIKFKEGSEFIGFVNETYYDGELNGCAFHGQRLIGEKGSFKGEILFNKDQFIKHHILSFFRQSFHEMIKNSANYSELICKLNSLNKNFITSQYSEILASKAHFFIRLSEYKGDFSFKEKKIQFMTGNFISIINPSEFLTYKCENSSIYPLALYTNIERDNCSFSVTWHYNGDVNLHEKLNESLVIDFESGIYTGAVKSGIPQEGYLLTSSGKIFEVRPDYVLVEPYRIHFTSSLSVCPFETIILREDFNFILQIDSFETLLEKEKCGTLDFNQVLEFNEKFFILKKFGENKFCLNEVSSFFQRGNSLLNINNCRIF